MLRLAAVGQPEALPIEEAREAFEEALGSGAPVVVVAPTGSGKSTQLPGWIADSLAGSVLIVEPRRVACRALATWVARLRGGALGEEVGYRVRFDDRSSRATKILFVTPGIALNLLAEGGIDRFAAIMVDEFHERSWEIDLLVALVRRARAAGSESRLLLCSATLDTEALVERMGARRVEAKGRRFAVEIEYRGDAIPSPRDLELRVAAAVDEALAQGPTGDVLVFLPGKGEIERCRRALSGREVSLCPVHGGLPPKVLMQAFAGARGRRVFLATNVAETSLTLPGVTTVIDSGLVRRRQHQAGRSVLALVAISGASMDQRAGRAGRVAPGRCVRLWSERFVPEPITPPEITRVELDELVLRASQCGLAASELAAAPWVEAPPAFALAQAIGRLRTETTLDEAGNLTAIGRARARLPVSAFSARILVDPPSVLAGDVADLVAVIEIGRDLLLPSGHGDSFDEARRDSMGGAVDEVELQLLALRRGQAHREGLHPSALDEARRLARALRAAVGAPSRSTDVPFDRGAMVAHLLLRVPEAVFAPRPRAAKGRGHGRHSEGPVVAPWGNGEIEVLVRPTWIPGRSAEEQPTPPEAGLILDLEWLGHGRSAQGRGRLLLRCLHEEIHAAGLGEIVVGDPILRRGDRRREVVADLERRYAGVVIHREREALHGVALCEGIAVLILQGRLMRGLNDSLRDDLHLWSLVEQEGEGPIMVVPSARDYLRDRLGEAGLSALGELSLLGPEDLRPDVESRAHARGLGHAALQSLRTDFPRLFIHEGNTYACHVELGLRRVTLEAQKTKGRIKIKGGGEPPVRVLPRFRGFSVDYRKASRQLRLR